MLHRFIAQHREEIIAGARAKMAARTAPRPTTRELEHGVPQFLAELLERLRDHEDPGAAQISASASLHGSELLAAGFTVGQVVHGYGDVCQSITSLMVELGARIETTDFRTLNLCLDVAIAEAVTEYTRQREVAIVEHGAKSLGFLAHELRNLLGTATLALEVIRSGSVGVGGSTGQLLADSLIGMGELVARSLAEVRLDAGVPHDDRIVVSDMLGEIAISARLGARPRGIQLTFEAVGGEVAIDGDALIVASIITNLVQNACKFTREHGAVVISTRTTADRVLIDIADECGGLPPGLAERLFLPYEQRGADRSGMGLGLAICQKSARTLGGDVSFRDVPGVGCVFTADLRRSRPV